MSKMQFTLLIANPVLIDSIRLEMLELPDCTISNRRKIVKFPNGENGVIVVCDAVKEVEQEPEDI